MKTGLKCFGHLTLFGDALPLPVFRRGAIMKILPE